MNWWIFDTQAAAEAAEALASASLPPDLYEGQPVNPPITKRWAEVQATADGRWAFPAKPGMNVPNGAVVYEQVSIAGNVE